MIKRPARLAALALLACSTAAAAAEPQVGDVIDIRPGQHFRGWHLQGAGLGVGDQPFLVFDQDNRVIVALTSVAKQAPSGGIAAHRISQVLAVAPSAGEEVVEGYDCPFLNLMPAIAFYDQKARVARGIFVGKDGIVTRRWFADREECQYSGD